MAQNDLAGLLTGVSQQRRNPLNPMSSNLTPDQQWMAMGAQNVGVMQSGMRGLMGTPSVDEQRAELKSLIAGLDPTVPADAEKLIKYYTAIGDRTTAAKIRSDITKSEQLKQSKTTMVQSLRDAGRPKIAEALANNGITLAVAGSALTKAYDDARSDVNPAVTAKLESLGLAELAANYTDGVINATQANTAVIAHLKKTEDAEDDEKQRAVLRSMAVSQRNDEAVKFLDSGGPLATVAGVLFRKPATPKAAAKYSLGPQDRIEYDYAWKDISEKTQAAAGVLEVDGGVLWLDSIDTDAKFKYEIAAERRLNEQANLGVSMSRAEALQQVIEAVIGGKDQAVGGEVSLEKMGGPPKTKGSDAYAGTGEEEVGV